MNNSTQVNAGGALMSGGTNTQLTATEFRDMDTVAKAAGLDFNIRRSAVAYKDQHGNRLENKSVKQLFRDDTGAPLGGTVSNRFRPLQPRIALEVANSLVNEAHGYHVTGAGSIDGGAGLWIIAKKGGFDLAGDKVDHAILLTTDNTGKQTTRICQTSTRFFCTNQMPAAFRNALHKISVRHTTNWTESYIRSIVAQIRGFSDAADSLASAADNMARTGMTDRQAVNYFVELYAERDNKDNITNEPALERIVNQIMQGFKTGPGADHVAARGTQWGALNAVTHYVDHVTRARSDENRFKSAIGGAGYDRKIKAIELIQGIDGQLIERETVRDLDSVSGEDFVSLLAKPVKH